MRSEFRVLVVYITLHVAQTSLRSCQECCRTQKLWPKNCVLWKVVAPGWKTQHSVSGMKDGRGRITTMDNIFIIYGCFALLCLVVECWAIFSHQHGSAYTNGIAGPNPFEKSCLNLFVWSEDQALWPPWITSSSSMAALLCLGCWMLSNFLLSIRQHLYQRHHRAKPKCKIVF